MSWVRIESHYSTHPKIMMAGADGLALDVCGMCYCREHNTNGFIPEAALSALGPVRNPRKVAEKLASAGRWERIEGGWMVHDFGDYNPSDAQDQEAADARRAKAKAAARARWHPRSNAQALPEHVPEHKSADARAMPPSLSLPVITFSSSLTPVVAGPESEEEDEYLDVWQYLAKRQLARANGVGNRTAWLAAAVANNRRDLADEARRLDAAWVLTRNELAEVLDSGVEQSAILRYAEGRPT